MLALDKMTGKLIWQAKEFRQAAQYASIVIAEHNGRRQYIQLTQSELVGIDSETGDVLWTTDWTGRTAVIPTPIFHDGHVYIASGYGVGCKLIRLGSDNSVEVVYENKVMKNHHGGVILIDDHVYGYSDGVGWTCQNFYTGERVWNEKRALGKGAVAFADGMLYCLEEKTGTVALIEASANGWKEHSRFVLGPQTDQRSPKGKVWTHPVISNGKLYLRDQEIVAAYDIAD